MVKLLHHVGGALVLVGDELAIELDGENREQHQEGQEDGGGHSSRPMRHLPEFHPALQDDDKEEEEDAKGGAEGPRHVDEAAQREYRRN